MPPRGRMDARVKPTHDEQVGSLRRGSTLPPRRFAALALFLRLLLTGGSRCGHARASARAGAWMDRGLVVAQKIYGVILLGFSPRLRIFYAGAWTRGSSRTLPISWARTLTVSSPSAGAERHTITSPGFTGLTPSGVPV